MPVTCRLCSRPAEVEGLCAACALRAVRAARRQDKRARLAEVPKSPLDDRLLWPSEVAMRLRVDRTTVYRLLKAGKLRGVRVGRRVQVKLSSLEAFLVKNRTRQV